MGRLIDADALKRRTQKVATQAWKMNIHARVETVLNQFIDFINDAPTVDAVPVVRCKDCKHRDPQDGKCDCGHDILWQQPRSDDWYCADGERREE